MSGRVKEPDLGPACPFLETQEILDALQPFDPPAKPVPITVTDANNRKFFRKWSKSTSTSPSEKHLGHYKALLSCGLEQDPPIKPLADAIIELQLQLSNVALMYGHLYDCWKQIVSVMIEKKSGLFLLEKLRTIHLFEVDYKWLLGFVFGLHALSIVLKNKTNFSTANGAPDQEDQLNSQTCTRQCHTKYPDSLAHHLELLTMMPKLAMIKLS